MRTKSRTLHLQIIALTLVLIAMIPTTVRAQERSFYIPRAIVPNNWIEAMLSTGEASRSAHGMVIVPMGEGYSLRYQPVADSQLVQLPRLFPQSRYWVVLNVFATPPPPQVVYRTQRVEVPVVRTEYVRVPVEVPGPTPAPQIVYLDRVRPVAVPVKEPVIRYVNRPVLPGLVWFILAATAVLVAFIYGIAMGREVERSRISHLKLSIPELESISNDLVAKTVSIANRTGNSLPGRKGNGACTTKTMWSF